jgi:hypothetical protein
MNKVKSEKLKLICFGAGQQLAETCDIFCEFDFFDSIYKIVDNHPKKFIWHGKVREALSPDDVFRLLNPSEIIICISTVYYPEIYEQ